MRMNKAHRKAVNLSLDAGLVDQARALDLKLSGIAEKAIREAVRAEATKRWREDHAAALDEYNKLVEKRGIFNDRIPGWWNRGDGSI